MQEDGLYGVVRFDALQTDRSKQEQDSGLACLRTFHSIVESEHVVVFQW